MKLRRLLLALFLLAVGSSSVQAAFTFLEPTPYLSAADSPFDLSGLGTTFFLEDFEDLAVQPGMSADPVLMGYPILEFIRGIGFSVDGDDGIFDDSGQAGFSGGPIEYTGTVSRTDGIIRFEFDPEELGFSPTAVGFAITLNSGNSKLIGFDSFGRSASFDTTHILVNSHSASAHRFIGMINPEGISKFEFRTYGLPSSPYQMSSIIIDHLQYGLLVPEPQTFVLVVLGVSFVAALRLPANRKIYPN